MKAWQLPSFHVIYDFSFCSHDGVSLPSLVFPSRDRLAAHGSDFSVLAHIPIVLQDAGSVHVEASDYLRDRALKRWRVGREKRSSAGTARIVAYDLIGFLDWCSEVGVDWREIERGHDADIKSLVGYARMMADGRWSRSGTSVEQGTIDRRLKTAQDFLSYAASTDRSWRPPFEATSITGYGRHPSPRDELDIPSKSAVAAWLHRLRAQSTTSQHLLVQSVFEMGLRREEAIALRASDIPSLNCFTPDPYQHLEIRYGTKGGRDPADPGRAGKPRNVRCRSDFLERLHLYRANPKERPAALAHFRRRNPGSPSPEELFLNADTGEPFSLGYPNRLFTRGQPLPSVRWHPHVGRHFYACWTFLELLGEEANLAGLRRSDLVPSTLEAFGRPSLLRVQSYLGHVSSDTTDIYLQWASEHLRLNSLEALDEASD